jgi:hypothetical protein
MNTAICCIRVVASSQEKSSVKMYCLPCIVGFHPQTQGLVHYEPSLDALSWEKRQRNTWTFYLQLSYSNPDPKQPTHYENSDVGVARWRLSHAAGVVSSKPTCKPRLRRRNAQ